MRIDLTNRELQFLQRLVGHHMTGDYGVGELYGKLARTTEILGVHSDKPLPLQQTKSIYGGRVTFRVTTEDWIDYD